jgi:hypothetical protein
VFLLVGCLVLIGVAGVAGMTVLNAASTPAAQQGTALVRIDTNDTGGLATLRVLAAVPLGANRTLPAGVEVTTPSASLTEAMAPAVVPAVGASLSCDLQVGTAQGTRVIDLLRCNPAAASGQHS